MHEHLRAFIGFFLKQYFLKSLLKPLQYWLFMFRFWGHKTRGLLSSLTRDRTRTPCVGGWSLNLWTNREVPELFFQWSEMIKCWGTPQTPVGRLHFTTIATSSLEGQISNRNFFYFINFFSLLAEMIPSKTWGHLNGYEPHTENGMLSPRKQGPCREPCFLTWAPAQASWHLLLLFFTTHWSSLMACHGPASLASTWNPSY